MSMNTVPERLAALRAAMQANGVDVYLIPVGDPHSSEYLPDHYTSLTYFSGFHGENSNFVVTMTESAVWADGRYFVQAEKEIAGTEIQLMRMGEPGVPTAEQYCGKVLPEGGKLGLCGLTASCGLVRSLQKELDAKKGTIKLLDLEDELWTEGRPAEDATFKIAPLSRYLKSFKNICVSISGATQFMSVICICLSRSKVSNFPTAPNPAQFTSSSMFRSETSS